MDRLSSQVLREELEWLNYFPAGFKLNVPLTHTLGSLTLIGVDAYSSIVGQLAQWEVNSQNKPPATTTLTSITKLNLLCFVL